MEPYDCMSQLDAKVFIGFIPSFVTEECLNLELSRFGKISSLFFMPDVGHQSRGWAFVTFDEHEDGIAAVEAIDGTRYFEGSTEPCKASLVTSQYPPDYVRATCHSFTGPPTSPECWQQFTTSDGIPYYYNMRTGQTQWERPIDMKDHHLPVHKHAVGNSAFGPPGSNLFVFHLPSEWTDTDLIHYFQSFGSVVSARVQRDSSGRNRGFGFISYDNPNSALKAIKNMNGFSVGGKYLKVQLKKGEEQFVEPSFCGYSSHTSAESDLKATEQSSMGSTTNGSRRRGGMYLTVPSWDSDRWLSSSSQPNQNRSRSSSQTEYNRGGFHEYSSSQLSHASSECDCNRL